jgi:thiol:disulfide interchange protein
MKQLGAWIVIALCIATAQAQQTAVEVKFDPHRNAEEDIQAAVKQAQTSHKRIILDVGGEWCSWCHLLDKFLAAHSSLSALRDQNYIWVKVNYSPENQNKALLSKYPKIPGYPHLFVLDANGRFLHSQDTQFLEEGKGYNLERMAAFLERWKP